SPWFTALPKRASMPTARRSSLSEEIEGRGIGPIITSSAQASFLKAFSSAPTWPSLSQTCGTVPAVVFGSVKPSKATTKTGRPWLWQRSTTCRGRGPPPAISPSLPAMKRLLAVAARLADRALAVGLDEAHDIHHRLVGGKEFRGIGQALRHGALVGE